MIAGGALGGAAVVVGAAPASASAEAAGGPIRTAATRSQLSGLDPASGTLVWLDEGAGAGWFRWQAGDYLKQVAADRLQGIYVAARGHSGCWMRVWDNTNGRPEWFGVEVNNAAAAVGNLAALRACVALCPVTLMAAADYWISGTWNIDTPYRTLAGQVISDAYDTGHGTRILSTDATQPVMQLGPDSRPRTLSDFMRNVHIQDVALAHAAVLRAPEPGNEAAAVSTMDARFLLNCQLTRVAAWESLVGFRAYGCVATRFVGCQAFRSVSHTGNGDFFRGFWAVGAPAVAAGGNPSIYITDCGVQLGGGGAISKIGLYADGEFADLFVDRLETSGAGTGIALAGSGTGAYGRQNVHIRSCVLDQCTGPALDIRGLNAAATININGGYFQAKASAPAVISLRGGAGRITVSGGAEILCGEAGETVGVAIDSQPNVTLDPSVTIVDCPRPVVVNGASSGGQALCTINNSHIGDSAQPAIALTGQSRWDIRAAVTGKAGAFRSGVHLVGVVNTATHIDATRIDPASLAGSPRMKVAIDAANITGPGYYTSAGVPGLAGSGISVSGVTG